MKTKLEIEKLKQDLESKLNSLLDYNLRQVYISSLNTLNWILSSDKNFVISKNLESITDSRYKDLFLRNKNETDLESLEKLLLKKELNESQILRLMNETTEYIKHSTLYVSKDIIINLILSIKQLIEAGD